MNRRLRIVTFWVLISTLASMLPPSRTYARSATPAAPLPRSSASPVLPVPDRPAEAVPTGYTTAQAEAAMATNHMDAYEPMANMGHFDGTFSQRGPRSILRTLDNFTDSGTTSVDEVFLMPVGTQSVEFSFSLVGGPYTADAYIDILAPGSSTWVTAWSRGYPGSGGNNSVLGSETNKHIQLSWNAPRNQAASIRLRCANTHLGSTSGPISCAWSNIKFYHDVPGWSRSVPPAPPLPAEHVEGIIWGVRNNDDKAQNIPVQNGEYLAVEALKRSTDTAYEAPPIALPPFTGNDLTVSIKWNQRYLGTNGGFGLTLRLTDGTDAADMPINTTYDQTWQTTTMVVPADKFSAQVVRLRLNPSLEAALVPAAVAVDDIKFFYKGKELIMPLAKDGTVGLCSCDVVGPTAWYFADPVNTFSGAFVLDTTDLSLPSDGEPFEIRRGYASLLADTAKYPVGSMGAGWRANFQEVLTLPSSPVGEGATVIYETAQGTRVRFFQTGPTTFKPGPGVRATLALVNNQYKLTTTDKTILTFDNLGRLLTADDPHGRRIAHTYNGPSGYKDRVTHNATGRSLGLVYSSTSAGLRLTRVDYYKDALASPVMVASYSYNAAGLLWKAIDAGGSVTIYDYDANRRLTRIWDHNVDPATTGDTPVVTNTYDTEGRVTKQNELSGREITYAYDFDPLRKSAYITTMTVTPAGGGTPTIVKHHYRADGTPRLQEQNDRFLGLVAVRGNALTPVKRIDGDLRFTTLESNASGLPTKVTPPSEGPTTIAYDSGNRPLTVTLPLGQRQTMTYDASGNLMTSTVAGPNGETPVTTARTYTANHRIRTITDPANVVTFYEYDSLNRISYTIVGYNTDFATKTTYGYDDYGRVNRVTQGADTPLATTTFTLYRADGQVEKVIENYVAPGTYQPTINPLQNVPTEYGYDSQGRPLWTKTADGRYRNVVHYRPDGQIDWSVENPVDSAGNPQIAYVQPTYSPSRPDANILTTYGYDGLGRRITTTQHGIGGGAFNRTTRTWGLATTQTTKVEYDSQDRPIKVIRNYQPGQPASASVNVETETVYDGAGNVTWERDTGGRWTRYRYIGGGKLWQTIVNYENGDATSVGNPAWTDGTDTDLISEISYDASTGLVFNTVDNRVNGQFDLVPTRPITDRVTRPGYDTLGRQISLLVNEDVTNNPNVPGTNRETKTHYDPTTGRVHATRDARGAWTVLLYDEMGRQKGSIANCMTALGVQNHATCATWSNSAPDRNVPGPITRYDTRWRPFETVDALTRVTRRGYDALGRVTTVTQNYVAGGPVNSETNVTTTTVYDAMGRVTSTTDATNKTTTYQYNHLGQQIKVTDPEGRTTEMGYDGTGTLRWTRTHDGRFTVIGIDGLNREIERIFNYENGWVDSADGVDRDLQTFTEYDVAGNVSRIIDPQNRSTRFGYDHLDRLVQVTENAVSPASCLATDTDCNVVTRYRYDRQGNRTTIIDARGKARHFEYTAADELAASIDPLGNREERRYTANGELTNINGPVINGTLRQLVQTNDALGRPTSLLPQGNMWLQQSWTYDILGRMVTHTDNTSPAGTDGTLRYTYTALNQVKTVLDPRVGTTTYAYTARGERQQVSYPNTTTVVDYTYYGDGQLKTVSQGGVEWAEYLYDTAGRAQTLRRNNDTLITTWAYDNADRVTGLTTTANWQQLASFAYTLDRGGQRRNLTSTVGGVSSNTNYTYDRLNRLTKEQDFSANTVAEYTYDVAGNRTTVTKNAVTQLYTYNDANQVTNAGWSYDASGNLLHDGTREYFYDAFNRLRSVMVGGVQTAYGYHGEDLVTAGSMTAITHRYAQDYASPLHQMLEIRGTNNVAYVYGDERLGALETGSVRTWSVQDALGSVHGQLNGTGTFLTQHKYDAWGVSTGATAPSPFGFTGEFGSNGLVYLRARWYNPANGTLLGKDPFEGWDNTPYSLHPYQYGYSNPVSNTDPTGRCVGPLIIACAIMGASAAVALMHGTKQFIQNGYSFENFDLIEAIRAGAEAGVLCLMLMEPFMMPAAMPAAARLSNSEIMADGDPTDEILPGVSAVGRTGGPDELADDIAPATKPLPRPSQPAATPVPGAPNPGNAGQNLTAAQSLLRNICADGDCTNEINKIDGLRARYRVGKDRNMALMRFSTNKLSGERYANSSKHDMPTGAPTPTHRFFNTDDRPLDSEVKLLEELAHKLTTANGVDPSVTGNITIFSERIPCHSCADLLTQFTTKFPGITIEVGWWK